MNAVRGRVTESGRVSLPAEFRKALGLDRGGDVVFELEGGNIRISTVQEVVGRSQALAAHLLKSSPEGSLDAFLAERRREAEAE